MKLSIRPPKPWYGVIFLTVRGKREPYIDVGPVLAATYDRRQFEVIYPFRAIVTPISWEIVEGYGHLSSFDDAIARHFDARADIANLLLLDEDSDVQPITLLLDVGNKIPQELVRRRVY